jgi:hypothetical protein
VERNVEGDSDVIETINRDGLLPTLHLADKLPAQAGALPEPLLAQAAILAKPAKPFTKGCAYVRHGAFRHGHLT